MIDIEIEKRKPVWIALSEFYLDTELQPRDFEHIAKVMLASPYNWEEIKAINKYEVFPVLQANLLSVVGEWAGFDEQWLVETIATHLQKQNLLTRVSVAAYYKLYKWMCTDYWIELEATYHRLKETQIKEQS